ncbi:MAG: Gfo/Idh/MocA family oxidoreductase [Planctomycetes bacterium]|nr:Gfo/Idh/MocA family oxidoreductase [Planctomycetota bacterium]
MKVILIGCGAVAQKLYRKPLQKLEKQGVLRVVGLVDRHLPHARVMSPFFRHASSYDQIETALRATEPDLTLVLSPAHLHAEHAILAMRARSHVLCEKPMATTEHDCALMIAAARQAERVLAIGMTRRFFPAFSCLKQWISSDGLGTIESFQYREGRRFEWQITTSASFLKRGEGGAGVLFDIGPHAIDLLLWLFGTPEVTSYADDALAGVDSYVSMKMETPRGPGSMHLCWNFPLANELRVYGSKGEAVLRIDQPDRLAIKRVSRFEEIACNHSYPANVAQPSRRALSPKLYVQAIYCQLIQTMRAIQLGESPAVTAEEGRQCVAVIEAARRIAQPIRMTWLNPTQQSAFTALHWTN